MAQEALAMALGLTEHLYSALSLAERAACLRQDGNGRIGLKADTSRAAAYLQRWKSQKPFPAGDSFEKRLRLDGLTEEDLLAILGLPPEVYSELITSPPDWVRELERLYLTPRALDKDPEFLRDAGDGTNEFLWIAYPLFQEGLRRFREGAGRLPAQGVPFDPITAERLVLPHLFKTLQGALDLVMVLELNVARPQGVLKGETSEERPNPRPYGRLTPRAWVDDFLQQLRCSRAARTTMTSTRLRSFACGGVATVSAACGKANAGLSGPASALDPADLVPHRCLFASRRAESLPVARRSRFS